ncbi:S53 family peptidase [Burkholderia ambifaria]|uniref:S53 family peptidase n=1 Tax=Burkholderia ambifaria TaxID=152480 RepID=UPI00158A6EAF|nr:S53 family peptidase [Burkholderia ambifaria]
MIIQMAIAATSLLVVQMSFSVAATLGVATSGWVGTVTPPALIQPVDGPLLQPLLPGRQLPISVIVRRSAMDELRLSAHTVDRSAATRILNNLASPGTRDKVTRIEAYLRREGFTDIHPTSDGAAVSAMGSVRDIERAFGVTLKQAPGGVGEVTFGNTSEVRIPRPLADAVVGVVGLDNQSVLKPIDVMAAPRSGPAGTQLQERVFAADGTAEVVRHAVEDLPVLYNAAVLPAATDVTAAVIAVGNLGAALHNLATFEQLYNLHADVEVVQTANASTEGYHTAPSDLIEWDMDTQLLLANAGGLKKLIIYNVPDYSWASLIGGMQRAVEENRASIISTSLYGPEQSIGDDVLTEIDAILSRAINQDQNFLFCSGDDGIYRPQSARPSSPYYPNLSRYPAQRQIGFPASHPYVIAVGATELQTSPSAPRSYVRDVAWNIQTGHGITQGGVSHLYRIPAWQPRYVSQLSSERARSVPDVAFNGSGASSALVISTNADGTEGPFWVSGSSAATPTFAGLLARIVQKHGQLGFIGDRLYQYASQRTAQAHDVQSGTNGLYGDGYVASVGWDAVSGWGSLDIADLDAFLSSGAVGR